MTEEQICTRVRAIIDALVQARPDGVTLTDDYENLNEIIKDKISYALVYVLSNASGDLLEDAAEALDMTTIDNADVEIRRDGVIRVKLPEGTLRVLSARLKTWMKSPEPVSESSAEATMQLDYWARGSWDRPVVVLRREGGDLWLELYSGRGGETKKDIMVSLVSDPTKTPKNDSTEVAVPFKLEAAFLYEIAGLVCVTVREDISGELFSIANKYLGQSEAAN